MRIEDTPFHITGLEKFVELGQEQAFMGKAALTRLAETGVDRKLVGVDIGYAWVPATHAAVGTALEIADPRGRRRATVVAIPFVDPDKQIPKE